MNENVRAIRYVPKVESNELGSRTVVFIVSESCLETYQGVLYRPDSYVKR